MKNLRSGLLYIFLFLASLGSYAQPLFFEKKFGTAASDQSLSVKQLSDGSIYIAGSSDSIVPGEFDVTLSKLDRYGNLLWTKYYNGGKNDFAFQLAVLADNSLVLAGSRQQLSGFYDALIIRTDTSGTILFQNTFGDPVQDESFAYVSADGLGKLIACGYSTTPTSLNDAYVVRMDISCNQIWQNKYGGADIDYGQRIIPANDSGYIFVGDTHSFGSGTYDPWLCKIDTMGGIEWNYFSVDTLENGSQGVICTADGNFLMFGETEIATGSPYNFFMEKVLTNGTSLWRKDFGDPLYKDALFEMIELASGEFICTGYSNSYNHGVALDLIVFQTDSTGNISWAESYGGPGIDIGYDLIPSYNGGYLLTGKTSISVNDEYYLLSLDSLGLLTSLSTTDPIISKPSLFPNPSDGQFELRGVNTGEDFTISVFDLTGRLLCLKRGLLADGFVHINLKSELSAGCYILKLEQDKFLYSTILIIQ